jgi:hypothetical protein
VHAALFAAVLSCLAHPVHARSGDPVADPEDFTAWVGISSFSSVRNLAAGDHGVGFGGVAYAARGWSMSVALTTESQRGRSLPYEALASYSYKLPLVDAHVGAVACDTRSALASCVSGFRLGVTSNNSTTSQAHLEVDTGAKGRFLFNAGLSRLLYRAGSVDINGNLEFARSYETAAPARTTTASVIFSKPAAASLPQLSLGYYDRRTAGPLPSRSGRVFVGLTFMFAGR